MVNEISDIKDTEKSYQNRNIKKTKLNTKDKNMPRFTLNGINARVNGLGQLLETHVANLYNNIKEIKKMFQEFRENELEHMRQDIYQIRADIDGLKKAYWKIMGGITVLVTAIEIIARILK